jgi:hypothetical protein
VNEIDEDFYKGVENMNVILSRTLLKTVDVSEKCIAKIKRLKQLSLANTSHTSNIQDNENEASNDSIGEIDKSCTSDVEEIPKENHHHQDNNTIQGLNSIFSFKSLHKNNQQRNHFTLNLMKKYDKRRQIYEKKRLTLSKTEPTIYHTESISPISNISRDNYGEHTPQTSHTMSR